METLNHGFQRMRVIDSIFINDLVLTDLDEGGWVPRINEVVEETKKLFLEHIKRILMI